MNQQPASNQTFELDQLLNKTLLHYQKICMQENIDLSIIDDMASPVMISGDPQLLRKLLQTVFDNIVENSGASRISLTTRQLLRSSKEILLEFLVEDNGTLGGRKPGIKYLRSIVGARQLIEMLGGKSEWNFTPGRGTMLKFIIKCHWREPQEHTSTKTVRDCARVLASKKILVVEDNDINQLIISGFLKKENISYVMAANGKEAIDILESDPQIDLVLMDQQLPHMDGLETSSYIRKILGNSIPIIGMLSITCDHLALRCLESGMNQFIKKPFTRTGLLQQMCSFYDPASFSKTA